MSWKEELKTSHPSADRGAWLHLWLGEWELAQNQQPEQAAWHFREAQRLTNPHNRCYGLAAYDQAISLFYAGAYTDATEAFSALLRPKTGFPGYDRRNCALWLRHAGACANYHAQNASLGIPEPPRLDPYCGAASLAACLRSLSLPYDRQAVRKVCPVTGEGSTLADVLNAGRKLGLNARSVTADDQGLMALPKPLVAYVEQDHFVALVRADAKGVSYLCSDCGPWPGGRVDLTWAQWHSLNPGIYAGVTKPRSASDILLREALAPQKPFSHRGVQVSYTGALSALHLDFHLQASLASLRGHVNGYNAPKSTGCGSKPEALHCPKHQTCAMVCPLHNSPHAAVSGDPVNAGTGEEEYTPDPDLVVYNPIGPSVSWSRLYNSLRAPLVAPNQNPVDYGVGWSYSYNYRLYAPNGFSPTGNYAQPLMLIFPNGYSYSLTYVGSNNPSSARGTALSQTPYAVAYANGVQLILKDHSRLTFHPSSSPGYSNLSALTDRWGHSIHFNFSSYPFTITDDNSKVLLTINGNQLISDCYGRTVWYQVGTVASKNVPSQYLQSFTELTGVSQTVATSSNPPSPLPMRYTYGYDNVLIGDPGTGAGESVAFLHTITVPSPTGTGSSTATLWYLNEQTDGTKTNPNYLNPNTNSNSGPFVSAIVDSNGNTTTITPTAAAFGSTNQTTVQFLDSKGTVLGTSLYGFDSQMRLTSMTDYNQKTTKTLNYTGTAYAYKPSSVTDGNGNIWSYNWDTFGNLLTETPPAGTANPPTSSTSSTRTPATTNYGYDFTASPLGDVNSIQIGNKKATTVAYTYTQPANLGPSDYIKSITGPQPGKQGTSAPTVTTSFVFDAYGNLTSLTTPGNNATVSGGADQGITTTFGYTSDGAFTQAEGIGEPLTVTDNLGHTTHLRYDAQGQTIATTDALGHETDQSYNENGGTVSLGNQLQSVTLPATNQNGSGQGRTVYSYQYVGGPLSSITTYDESGSQIRQVGYQYGSEEELLAVGGSTEPAQYAYDGLYRVVALADGNGNATRYNYNPNGYLDSILYPGYTGAAYPNVSGADSVHFSQYDGDGNPLKRIDGNGVETDYVYNDPESLLTNINYPGGQTGNVSYAYDVYGRTASMTDGTGVLSYPSYDDLDNPLAVQTAYTGVPTMSVSYGYYNDGSRSAMTLPSRSYTYLYDQAGRPKSVANNLGQSAAYAYQNNDWLQSQSDSNGLQAVSTYDALGRLVDLKNTVSSNALSEFGSLTTQYGIVHDGVSNEISVPSSIASLGSGTTTYSYDQRDQLTQETSGLGGYTNIFAYDTAGNATSLRGLPQFFNFDNQAMLPAGNNAAFASDGNGNPGAAQGHALTFDPENRLTLANDQTTSVPTAATVGPDNVLRLLSTNSDGSVSVENISLASGGGVTQVYGPYAAGGGWSCHGVAVGSDANPRILWTNSNGTMSVWTLGSNGSFTSTPGYGPYAGGWTCTAIAVGPDGLTRALWIAANGTMQVWRIAANGAVNETPGYTASGGWSCHGLAVGPDNKERVLWTNVNGSMSVWTITLNADGTNSFTSSPGYSATPGWTCTGLSVGPDNLARTLWVRKDGAAQTWQLNTNGSATLSPILTPQSGYAPVNIAMDYFGADRLLFSDHYGDSYILNILPDNSTTGVQISMSAGHNPATAAGSAYRGDGLRASKSYASGKTYFLYDGDQPVEEFNSSGTLTADTLYGPAGPIVRNDTTRGTAFYAFDERGNVAQRVSSSGSVASTDLYDAYGKLVTGNPSGDPNGYGAQAGYYTDSETGLLLLTHRFYDPAQGRFLTRDPMGPDGGINLYSYTQNDPGNRFDPNGTDIWGEEPPIPPGYPASWPWPPPSKIPGGPWKWHPDPGNGRTGTLRGPATKDTGFRQPNLTYNDKQNGYWKCTLRGVKQRYTNDGNKWFKPPRPGPAKPAPTTDEPVPSKPAPGEDGGDYGGNDGLPIREGGGIKEGGIKEGDIFFDVP